MFNNYLSRLCSCCTCDKSNNNNGDDDRSVLLPNQSKIDLSKLVSAILAWKMKHSELFNHYYKLTHGISDVTHSDAIVIAKELHQEATNIEKSINILNNNELLSKELTKAGYCSNVKFQWPIELINELQENINGLKKTDIIPPKVTVIFQNRTERLNNITPNSSRESTPGHKTSPKSHDGFQNKAAKLNWVTPDSSTSNTPANISREITPNTTPSKRGNTNT